MTTESVPGSSYSDKLATIPFEASYFWRFILHRLNRNQEALILITGHEATRGIGKTHLAVSLAKTIHRFGICPHCDSAWFYKTSPECPFCEEDVEEWGDMPPLTAEKNTTVGDVDQYVLNCLDTHREGQIFDEVAEAADNRNPMSKDLRKFRQALLKLRMQNNVAIMTVPTAEVVDNSVQGLLDIWINCMRRGDARAYHFWVNDQTGAKGKYRMRIENGMAENIHWRDQSGDPVIKKLDDAKRQLMFDSLGGLSEEDREAFEKKKKEWWVEVTERLLEHTEISQVDIADYIVDPSQQWVSQANRGKLNQQENDGNRYPIRD